MEHSFLMKINRSDFPRPNFNHIKLGSVRFGFSQTRTDPNIALGTGGPVLVHLFFSREKSV